MIIFRDHHEHITSEIYIKLPVIAHSAKLVLYKKQYFVAKLLTVKIIDDLEAPDIKLYKTDLPARRKQQLVHITSELILFIYILYDRLDLLCILDPHSAKTYVSPFLVPPFQDIFNDLYAYLQNMRAYLLDQTFPADHDKLLRL